MLAVFCFIMTKRIIYQIQGAGVTWTWKSKKSNSSSTFSKEEIIAVQQKAVGTAVVKEVKKKAKKSYAPQLYDLTSLQQEANKKYGFSAKQTLNYMQSLYEHHKVVTYPRTDARYLTTDIVDTLPERVKACRMGEYAAVCGKILKTSIQGNKSFIDNSKVSDHHAIIPTEQSVRLQELEYGERKIYELVVSRFLAVLLPPCEYEQTEVIAECGGELFTVKGKRIVKPGFQEVYQGEFSEEDDDTENIGFGKESKAGTQTLPAFEKGQKIIFSNGRIKEGATKPPQPFTDVIHFESRQWKYSKCKGAG